MSAEDRPDVLVLGGGPAGMAAALEASRHGASVVLVDENQELGGQIYRAPITAERRVAPRGQALRDAVKARGDGIQVLRGWSAWGVFPGPEVALTHESESRCLWPRRLILAPGAHEFVPPFEGWCLPGVMTPGAAQVLAKTMGVAPGRRVLVAGSGPFLLTVAEQLVSVGCQVVGVLEAAPRKAWRRLPLAGWRTPDILLEGLRLQRSLRRAGVPLHFGRRVTAARGESCVERVEHAPVDANWGPDLSRQASVDVDTLCISFGFTPRIQLAQQAGCELELNEVCGGWMPRRDADMRTSVPEIFAAGDGAGVAGALVAEGEGQLSGLSAARDLERVTAAESAAIRRPILARLARMQPLRAALDAISAPRPGLDLPLDQDTVVCRCEEITAGERDAAIDAGGHRFRSLKVMTRLGMGACQGRFCWPATARRIAKRVGCSLHEVGPNSPRPPARGVTFGALASAHEAALQQSSTRERPDG
jgi:NADPH-dependent 2,4-dienoyl-CoA reductase/sulfur reductase-like enzyme